MALSLYLLTFNCGRALVQPDCFAPYLFEALKPNSPLPELLVLSLQELAPIGPGFLGGSFITPYYNAFRKVVKLASKDHGYVNVITRNIGLTAIMVFARDDVADNINWLHTAEVGLGVSDMGNKGAVGIRLGYKINETEETLLTFVAAHLAPMEDGLEQRNEDYKNIVRRLVFIPDASRKPITRGEEREDAPLLQSPIPQHSEESGIYSSTSHLFFAGDLNYRTSSLQPSPLDAVEKFPQPTKDEANPRHFKHLLAEDQLTQEIKAGKTLHGLTEAPIEFPPTYKYDTDPNKAVTLDGDDDWHWARHRWPSWCDRIFFLSNDDVAVDAHTYTCLPLFATSDHRPVALAATVPLKSSRTADHNIQEPPFSIDPQWRAIRVAGRRKELIVGLAAYLTLTREGNGLALATILGALGGWWIIRSLLIV